MLKINFVPFPKIDTERLVLRELNINDAEGIFALRSDETVLKYTSIAKPNSINDATAYIEKILNIRQNSEGVMWAMVLKSEDRLIGNICFWNIVPENYRAEIGYSLLSAYHGKGYMQKAISLLLITVLTE